MEIWISIVKFWFFNMSERIDISAVILAVALSIYALFKGRDKSMACLIIISFVGFYLFSQQLEPLHGIEGFMFFWLITLAIKDSLFGLLSHMFDYSSRLPVAYTLQVIITLLVLLVMNRQVFSPETFKFVISPIWSILYSILMVLKLTIYFSETRYGKGRPLFSIHFDLRSHLPAPMRWLIPRYRFFDQPDYLLHTKRGV